jgi:hypothetical protein
MPFAVELLDTVSWSENPDTMGQEYPAFCQAAVPATNRKCFPSPRAEGPGVCFGAIGEKKNSP